MLKLIASRAFKMPFDQHTGWSTRSRRTCICTENQLSCSSFEEGAMFSVKPPHPYPVPNRVCRLDVESHKGLPRSRTNGWLDEASCYLSESRVWKGPEESLPPRIHSAALKPPTSTVYQPTHVSVMELGDTPLPGDFKGVHAILLLYQPEHTILPLYQPKHRMLPEHTILLLHQSELAIPPFHLCELVSKRRVD